MLFELLESRNLFSVSLSAGVLTVTGTNLNDAITINKNASGQLAVSDDGVLHNYAWGSVKKLIVNALGGNDSVISQNTMDKPMVVHGGDGSDSIYGGAGNDSLFGDGGNDVIDGRKGNDDMHGGDGEDTVDYTDRVNDITVSLDDVANDGVAGMSDNVHSDIEVVLGGKGNDHIYGGPTTVAIYGNGGNDSIYGGTGAAALYGGDGNDLLVGGTGNVNTYVYIWAGAGDDTVYTNAPLNYVRGELGNDYISSYSHGYNIMYGDYGDDTLSGGSGENDLHGGFGNDRIDAFRGTGMNWLNGDEGNDTLTGAAAGDTELRGEAGDDLIRGGGGRNWIWGDAGNDQLHAAGIWSWVSGGDDADSLWGGPGADTLNGDGGADVIVSVGGGQNDVVSGGDGPDSFWTDAETSEVITDADAYEGIINSVHRVGHFFNTDRELNGQSIADPTDSGTTKNFANDPLFSNLGPQVFDVKQGAVGDCYFLTALMAASKDTWMPIRESVADLGDGTFAVQFWRNNLPYIVRVDADLPVDASGQLVYAKLGYQNSLWVPIMEKAFTYFRTGASTYASINLGTMHEALDDVHARQTTDLYAWDNGGDLLNYIQSELNAGKVVTISTPATITAGCPCVGSHAYLVMQVNYKTVRVANAIATFVDSVVLRNPWGVDGVSDGSDPSDGYVTVSASAAGLNFSAVTSAYM